MKPEFRLTADQIDTLDRLLKAYYENRKSVGELMFEDVVYRLTNSHDHEELFVNQLKNDGYLEMIKETYNGHPSHFGHITRSGISFHESGGYSAQAKAQRSSQEQESQLRLREINAAEESAEAAKQSAKSAEESNKRAKEANYISLFSVLVSALAFGFSLFQYFANREQNLEIDSLRKNNARILLRVRALDSLIVLEKRRPKEVTHRKDSLRK